MKNIALAPLIMLAFAVGIIVLSTFAINSYQRDCKNQGGIVVQSYLSNNCWKDGNFIDLSAK